MNQISFREELTQTIINIPRAAFVYARDLAYPTLNIDDYLARLDDLTEDARNYVSNQISMVDRIDALSDFLFYQENFRGANGTGLGNDGDYSNPENSYLNRVLDTRLGIPITLSIIYVSIAQRIGINAYGIGLPGHFIVGVYCKGTEIYIDPFNSGLRLSIADCGRLVRESTGSNSPFQMKWLAPVSPTNFLARMLTNLCNAYIQREDWKSAIPVLHYILMVQPDMDFHLRDLGFLYMYNGSLRLSAQYLDEYLKRSPDAEDFDQVKSSLEIVAGRLALWN